MNASSLRILIVEDNTDGAQALEMLLRLSGYAAEIAKNGVEALAMKRTNDPDAVLLDIGLPGMDGDEVAKQLTPRTRRETSLYHRGDRIWTGGAQAACGRSWHQHVPAQTGRAKRITSCS